MGCAHSVLLAPGVFIEPRSAGSPGLGARLCSCGFPSLHGFVNPSLSPCWVFSILYLSDAVGAELREEGENPPRGVQLYSTVFAGTASTREKGLLVHSRVGFARCDERGATPF